MLPSSQSYASSSTSSISGFPHIPSNYNAVQPFQNQQAFLPQMLQDHTLHPGTDPNSPDLFKQNIQIVHEHVARLQNLARTTLAGMRNAYHSGNNPAQTEADLATLKQTLRLISEMMRQTGVGGLPLLPMPSESESAADRVPAAPTEQEMVADATRGIKTLYERLKRSQDSAAVVANLLGAQEHTARGGK